MIQLILGISGGIIIDGGVTFLAIHVLKKWNKETLDNAQKVFEDSIEKKSTEIIANAMNQLSK